MIVRKCRQGRRMKVIYPTRQDAQNAAMTQAPRRILFVYLCEKCWGYHLTKHRQPNRHWVEELDKEAENE